MEKQKEKPNEEMSCTGLLKNPKPATKQEKQLETSSVTQEQEDSPEIETESTSSIESLSVPAINFKKYIGATGVRYIQMGQASHIQEKNK